MESIEKRFAHLLQPIRELTENWEVDIASELNDYLEEIDEMCITFDDGKTSLNFAHAALLIQGSACVYSKKVELLHSFVYQTLECVNSNKNKKKNNQTSESQENDVEAEDGSAEDHAEFTEIVITPSNHTRNPNTHPIKTVIDVPLPPECLIPEDTRAKQKLPLISLKGEILCSQKDFRLASLNPGNDQILLSVASSESRKEVEDHQHSARDVALEQPPPNDEAPIPIGLSAHAVNVDGGEDFLPLEENDMDLGPQEHIERQQAPSEGRMIRERRQVAAITPRIEDLPPAVDAWAFHDPYAVLEVDEPFKSGKCYKVPEGLDDGGKRKRKPRSSLPDFESWFEGNFNPPERKLKNGPHFTDLNYIYLTTVKDRIRATKRIYRKAGVRISDEEIEQTLLQPEDPEEQRHGEDGAGPHINPGEDHELPDNENDDFPDDIPAEFGGAPKVLSPDPNEDLSYEQLVTLRVDQMVGSSQGYTQETELSRRVKDWEDKIKPILVHQEQRPAFDIHDYGDRIVNALGSVGQHRDFSSLVSGLDNTEACKYFLASLQLANDYTVEINSETGLEENVDSMGLTLLSSERATDRFKNLQASE